MSIIRKPNKDSLSAKILKKSIDILLMKGGASMAKGWKNFGMTKAEVNFMFSDHAKWEVNREMKRLKERGVFEAIKNNNEVMYKLTADGVILMLREMIANRKKKLPDGRQCFLMYDIPETAKESRHLFRQIISEANFKLIQRSVWVSEYNVAHNMLQIIQLSGMSKWVKVIEGKEICSTPIRTTDK